MVIINQVEKNLMKLSGTDFESVPESLDSPNIRAPYR